jgi:hypothetical protein
MFERQAGFPKQCLSLGGINNGLTPKHLTGYILKCLAGPYINLEWNYQ